MEGEKINQNLLPIFMKHLVAVSILDKKTLDGDDLSIADYQIGHILFSSFVVSVQNIWFLMTAGHILKDIEARMNSNRRIVKTRLIDNFQGSQITKSIPFDFDNSLIFPIYKKEDGIDYGAIMLKAYYARLLSTGGIIAFDEKAIENPPDKADEYYLLGFPTQARAIDHAYNENGGNIRIDFGCPLISIQPINNPPAELRSRERRFYAEVPIVQGNRYTEDGRMTDIDGMSGGPIIAVKRNDSGEIRYWIIAVQSSWLESKRIITACYIEPFISALGEIVKKLKEKTEDDKGISK